MMIVVVVLGRSIRSVAGGESNFQFSILQFSKIIQLLSSHWNIIGHEKQIAQLQHDKLSGNVAQAYLFCGPAHIGKFLVAKRFAQFLICQQDACGECHDCRLMESAHHPDVWVENDSMVITIEKLRSLQSMFQTTSASSYRILLISEMQRMSLTAQHACLKFLEEPPPKTVIIFTSSNYQSILDTILSRVRSFFFAPPVWTEKDAIIRLLSQERIGRAMSLKDNQDVYQSELSKLQNIQSILKTRDIAGRFSLVESLQDSLDEIRSFLDIFEAYLRAGYRKKPDAAAVIVEDYLNPRQRLALLQAIDQVRILLAKNVNKRLLLENLLLSF